MTYAIVHGVHQFPYHNGTIVELVEKVEVFGLTSADTLTTYKVSPILRCHDSGQEIYWQEKHLAQLPILNEEERSSCLELGLIG